MENGNLEKSKKEKKHIFEKDLVRKLETKEEMEKVLQCRGDNKVI